jgi:competence protein ComEC
VSRIASILALFTASLMAAPNLGLYFIDVEGGKPELLVSPSGQSMLLDVGWPAFNVISRFDVDHPGDVPQLAAKIPVGRIFDHGDYQTSEPQATQRFASYAALRERIVLSAGGQLIVKPLSRAGKRNALRDTSKQEDALASDIEDNQSIGLLITPGEFRMLDLADLEAHHSHDLVSPDNLIGTVDVYNVNVHGQFNPT